MRKKSKLLILLLFVFVFAGNHFIYAQDPFITIGKLKLRYDADSNKLRLGYAGTFSGIGNLRVAKELDGQLFDFNSQHFSWLNGKLNLNTNVLSEDSVATKKLTWKKDTSWIVLGETVSKWRTLTMHKSMWSNFGLSVPDWRMLYESRDENGTLLASANYYPLNDVKTWEKSVNDELTPSGNLIANDIIFPVTEGQWLVNGEAVVEFAADVCNSGNVFDSIWVVFGNGEDGSTPEVELSRTKIRFAYSNGVYCGLETKLIFTCVVNDPGAMPQGNYTIYAYCSNDANNGLFNIPRRMKYYKINAVLIH